ncbi:MAG TPA: response regulator [Bryobacteraceae bacterium]|jgi:CheY-like chemotaxis protein
MTESTRLSTQGRPVVLLAEDEPVVRNFVQMALTRAGYDVLAASDGIEALQLSRAYDGVIHLLLSDMQMPKMIGSELARTIVQERPDIRVLLMTGKSSNEIPQQLRPDLLRKPFLPRVLLGQIERVLS